MLLCRGFERRLIERVGEIRCCKREVMARWRKLMAGSFLTSAGREERSRETYLELHNAEIGTP
jgi:hypothetical protein